LGQQKGVFRYWAGARLNRGDDERPVRQMLMLMLPGLKHLRVYQYCALLLDDDAM
jgi:hypothetical protein